MNKCVALLLITLLAVSSLILIGLVSAHSTPKPSVPEFTAKMADHSYDVPLTTVNYTNPYTGQQETKANGGFHVENITIDIEIKNQHFTSIDIDGNTTGLFYVIRWKGHFENWSEYSNSDFNDVAYDNSYQGVNYAIPAANSDYTIKSYSLSSMGNIPQGGLVDFQVKAQIGYSFTYFGGHIQPIGTDYHWVQQSDWSNTQTITVGENTPLVTPDVSLLSQSSVPEFTLKYVDHSYYTQPTYTTDPYTGQQVILNEGGYTKNDSIEITIKNQPFTSYRDASGNYTLLYYNIRFKGHFGNQWQTYPALSTDGYWEASQSNYTVVSLPNTQLGSFTAGGQIDFQVQALTGYEDKITELSPIGGSTITVYHFHGAEGSWSDTQTVKINENTSTSTPGTSSPSESQSSGQSSTQTVFQLGLDWGQVATLLLLGVIAVLLVFAVVFLRKRSAK